MWYYHDGIGWWTVIGSMLMVIFWVLVILLVAWGIKRLSVNRNSGSDNRMSNLFGMANECYARVEISKEEFEQIKRDIS